MSKKYELIKHTFNGGSLIETTVISEAKTVSDIRQKAHDFKKYIINGYEKGYRNNLIPEWLIAPSRILDREFDKYLRRTLLIETDRENGNRYRYSIVRWADR